MIDLGDQLVVGVYLITVFAHCGIVGGAMLVLAIRQYRLSSGLMRVPAFLLAVGAAAGIELCIDVVIMDVAHVAGAPEVKHKFQPAYSLLVVLTFLFLCAGFVAQPALRFLRRRLRAVQTDALVTQLNPIWREANRARPGLSRSLVGSEAINDPEARLHRSIVEIRDAMIDPRAKFIVGESGLKLLEQAEAHLLGVVAPVEPQQSSGDSESSTESS